ncbi:hypothetical protein B0H13DRAFT_2438561 [Mycena leptocephala]|nr:hypothetical protein B0H13DRAFT_2438561 [Mycena leptocephala]
MGPTLAQVGSPPCLVTLAPSTQTTSVDEYQAAAIAFVELAHDSLPYDLYLACLGNSMVQPRAVTVRLLSRTQDETGLLNAGRESGLPMLAVHGAKDRIIVREAVLNAVKGWKNLTVVDIEDAEHFVWLRARPNPRLSKSSAGEEDPAETQTMSYSDLSPQNFLLMIENSSALAAFWPDLRDCYLPRLVEQLSGSHPAHLTNIFISESRPAPHDFHSSVTKQCSNLEAGLAELQFNYDLDNSLSVAQIQGGIKFLSSTPVTQVRHLIIVAATTPVDFEIVHPSYDSWNELARMLTKEEIYLHLALTSSLRSGRLPSLFEQTLKWQQHTEEPLWLPKYSTALIFRVSAPQTYPDSIQGISEMKAEQSTCPAPRAPRDPISSDIYTTKALDDVSSESPSLVSQLQQVHGLTKKKVYGNKPARVPFIMDERVRDRYRKTPSQSPGILVAPDTGVPPLLTRGGRSRSNLRADRALSSRPQRPVDPYATRQTHWPQSMPSPDGDSSDQSPYSSSNLSSPSSPVAQMPATESYPYAPSSSSAGHSMVSADLDLTWVPEADPTCSPIHLNFSQFLDPQASFHQDLPVPPPFPGIPTSCDTLPTASTSNLSHMSPLDSPAYLLSQPPSVDFGGTSGELDFQANLFQQRHDLQTGFPFPSIVPRTHIHAPAPSMAIPAGQMDLLVSAPTPRRILPPASILPSIAAPALQGRVEMPSVTATSQSMQPPNALYASSPARSAASSGRPRDAFASSSSSSLTGWAG